MRRPHWPPWLALLAGAVAVLGIAAAAPAAAAAPDPAAAASAYLQARAAAITATDPGAVLAPWTVSGTQLASQECFVARGEARRAAQLGHFLDDVSCTVTIASSAVTATDAATVRAHAVTTVTWHAASGAPSTEGSGVDHVIALRLVDGEWRVSADVYTDVLVPNYLEAAGVPVRQVRAQAERLERVRPSLAPTAPVWEAAPVRIQRYTDILYYDRDASRSYADWYALSYNDTFVRFTGADCANFASQCARAGGMPQAGTTSDVGWWYDRRGTASPGDDRYSLSWINVSKQTAYWTGRRTDYVSSIVKTSPGDFVLYDWTGDGTWDHVAVVAGTNSAGQWVIDAHTTDHYRVFWKLGSSDARYKFAHTRASWVV